MAIGHLNAGLQQVLTLQPGIARDRVEFELRLNLGTALIATQGYGSAEAGEAYARALALGESVGDNAVLYQALWGMWLTSSSRIGHLYSLELEEKLLRQAERNNDPLQLQQALYAMGNSLLWTGQLEQARQLSEATLMQANRHGFPLWMLSGSSMLDWALSMQGVAAGIAPIQEGLTTVRAAMNGVEAYFLDLLGDVYLHLGRLEESLSALNQALDVMNGKDDRFLQSEALRIKGKCLLEISATNAEEAEACFSQALAISRKQGAKSLELRAAISMARLWQRQDRQNDAQRLLEDIYNSFTEGFDTYDLQEASKLLALLGSHNKHAQQI